ncbi:MAG: DNA-protecting protein DprA [Micrococcales bacterium]|nr:DNA-protecting protein DprA [Micrococcales bacterium]
MQAGPNPEVVALVALQLARPKGLSLSQLTLDVLQAGRAVPVWEQNCELALFDVPNDPWARATRLVTEWEQAGVEFVTILDDAYPIRLLAVREAPSLLFYRGALLPDDQGMSVVGSRDASPRGITLAGAVARMLADSGLSVVSGLASGIDSAAHEAALETGGRTVALIGTGIDKCYPKVNQALQRRIAETGLVASQFWPGSPPTQRSFPMRNAVMSGYGMATIVVEAGEYSGTRVQARNAVEHGRPVVLFDAVVNGTEWGKALSEMPGVFVVSGMGDLEAAVERIQNQDTHAVNLVKKAMASSPK